MLGLELFMNSRKGKKDAEVTTPISYISGLLPLDYVNGSRIRVYDDDDNVTEEYDSVGFVDGTIVAFIADPHLGKTTLAQQIAVEITSKFENSFVVHEDVEHSSKIDRVKNVTGMPKKWIKTHYKMFDDSHGEDVMSRFLDHAKTKLNNRKEFEYDTGLKDMYGNKIKALIPTVVILDSISSMRSEKNSILDDDMSDKAIDSTLNNNMSAARSAHFNSEMFRQITPYLKKANIIFIVICQINNKIPTGFIPTPRALVGLGENETISGGRATLYLYSNVLRLKNKGQLKPDKDYGIDGNVISAAFNKSRSNANNVEVELIFDKETGFSKCLTLLHFAINNNIVKKNGTKLIIPGCEDSPFTKKSFIDTCVENPSLLVRLYDLCLPVLQEYLGGVENSSKNKHKDNTDISDYDDLDMMLDDF